MTRFAVLTVAVVALGSHMVAIGSRPVVDESIWLTHSATFAQAVADHEWQRTRTTTRPGVTVQWVIAGIYALAGGPLMARTVFAGITAASAAAAFVLLQRITPARVAWWAALLMPLQPLLVTGAVAWTDLLLGWIVVLAMVLFAAMPTLSPRGKDWAILGCGVLFGLAILTKIIGWITPAMLLGTIAGKKDWRIALQQTTGPLTGIVAIGILTAFILYPAAWGKPTLLLDRASEVTLTEAPTASVTSGLLAYAGQFFSYDPVLLILTAVSIIGIAIIFAQHKPAARTLSTFFLPAFIYAAALAGIAALSDSQVNQILSARYLIPITPLLIIGTLQFFDWLGSRTRLPVFGMAVLLLLASYTLLSTISFGVFLS